MSDPFELEAELDFEKGIVEAKKLHLRTPDDLVEVTGRLGPAPDFPESDLNLRASTTDIGRWRARIGLHEATVGPGTLEGTLKSDSSARFSTQAELTYAGGVLNIDGELGTLAGVLEPDVTVRLEAPDAAALGARFGLEQLPSVPATLYGRLGIAQDTVKLHDMHLNVDGTRADLDGEIQLAGPDTGGTLDIDFTSPSLGELGALFGRQQLPSAPFSARGRVSRPGRSGACNSRICVSAWGSTPPAWTAS